VEGSCKNSAVSLFRSPGLSLSQRGGGERRNRLRTSPTPSFFCLFDPSIRPKIASLLLVLLLAAALPSAPLHQRARVAAAQLRPDSTNLIGSQPKTTVCSRRSLLSSIHRGAAHATLPTLLLLLLLWCSCYYCMSQRERERKETRVLTERKRNRTNELHPHIFSSTFSSGSFLHFPLLPPALSPTAPKL
jgi:hypothetical protein